MSTYHLKKEGTRISGRVWSLILSLLFIADLSSRHIFKADIVQVFVLLSLAFTHTLVECCACHGVHISHYVMPAPIDVKNQVFAS